MKQLNPEKLVVEYRDGVTPAEPVIGRKYTLTHSDITGELFLTIGRAYAYEKINSLRDEVLAECRWYDGTIILYVYVYVNGQFAPLSARRDRIFRRELPLALAAIRYGDAQFFMAHPELDHAPILIYFDSTNPNYHRFENWGTPSDYRLWRSSSKQALPVAPPVDHPETRPCPFAHSPLRSLLSYQSLK
ncbi:hypothetical protein GTO89_15065 [Heliobacterium gestii]|uniref:Staygreen protein domain-containing protein n=1 Tax=Heliomicrobium gestii TaxID=2699 RepID=A0A845LCG7_HELGE|nr:hypothetical protein [Heliomicrobium gestii]MZP44352.1 hypothetical protein [Heliomicrobium gestii]